MANGHGGKRPNSGPAKGTKYAPTITKEAARDAVRQLVIAALEPMVKKQIAHAQGIDHFFLRNEKTKQFEQVKDPSMIEAALNAGDEDSYYWIFTKDPSVQAFSDLLNRALDKPQEQPQQLEVKGTVNVVDLLRQRYAKRKKAE